MTDFTGAQLSIAAQIDLLAATAVGIKNERDFLRAQCDRLIAEVAKLRRINAAMVSVLNDAREHIDGEIDVRDGDDGPRPNAAMSLAQQIDQVLERA